MSIFIGPNAQVYGSAVVDPSTGRPSSRWTYSARVYGSARVDGCGDVAHTRHVLTLGPLGSEDRHVTVHRHYDGPDSTKWGHLVVAGCWQGTLDQLAARIRKGGRHGWGNGPNAERWRSDYEAFITLARVRVAEWEAEPLTDADHVRWAEVSA